MCLGPCFSGCLVGTVEPPQGDSMEFEVSVLVLVDVWWVLKMNPGESLVIRRLGPCFSGCLVGTLQELSCI